MGKKLQITRRYKNGEIKILLTNGELKGQTFRIRSRNFSQLGTCAYPAVQGDGVMIFGDKYLDRGFRCIGKIVIPTFARICYNIEFDTKLFRFVRS